MGVKIIYVCFRDGVEEQIMTKQTPPMGTPTHRQRTALGRSVAKKKKKKKKSGGGVGVGG